MLNDVVSADVVYSCDSNDAVDPCAVSDDPGDMYLGDGSWYV